MIKDTGHAKILYYAAALGLVIFLIGVALMVYAPIQVEQVQQVGSNGIVAIQRPILWVSILSTACQALGAAILFPVLVSFAYDRLRERLLGDEVWRLFAELADAGITRVYKDREFVPGRDNAQTRLSEEFQQFRSGEICIMGPTLRVFFNVLGPFHQDIEKMLSNGRGDVRICALIERDESPSVADRTCVEEPHLGSGDQPQTQRDASGTVAAIRVMNTQVGPYIILRRFLPAPYCTAVIFPHVVYFSPNILAPAVPVRLPMILFRSGSHGYNMVRASFDYLWSHLETIQVVSNQIAVDAKGNAREEIQGAHDNQVGIEVKENARDAR